MKLFIILMLSLVGFIEKSYADYGKTFLVVFCDASTSSIEIEPKIIWNEELEKLETNSPVGNEYFIEGKNYLFPNETGNINFKCELPDAQINISVSERNLTILQNNRKILDTSIDNIWSFFGLKFKIHRDSKNTWEYLCVREELDQENQKNKCDPVNWEKLDLSKPKLLTKCGNN